MGTGGYRAARGAVPREPTLPPLHEAERIDLEHQRDQLLSEVEAIERRLGTGVRDYRGEHERKAAAWDRLMAEASAGMTLEELGRLVLREAHG